MFDRYLQIRTTTFYFLFLALILLYSPTFLDLYKTWVHPVNKGYSHGVLLSALLIVLLYKDLSKEKTLTLDLIYLPVIFLFSLLWAIARVGIIQSIEYISIYVVLFTLFLLISNRGRVERMYLLLAFLFAIPIWHAFNGILQNLTAVFSYLLLKLSFVPVNREGFHLLLPNGSFIVADFCSGLRQQIIGLTIISLYAYLNKLYIRQLMVLFILTIILDFILNLIRIYIVILAGYFTDMQSSLVEDHSVLGWSIFGVGMALYIALINRYFDRLYLTNQLNNKNNE